MHAPVVATLIGSPGLGPGLCHDRGLFSLTITTSDSRSEHTVTCQYYLLVVAHASGGIMESILHTGYRLGLKV
jgi:hypothetical protein